MESISNTSRRLRGSGLALGAVVALAGACATAAAPGGAPPAAAPSPSATVQAVAQGTISTDLATLTFDSAWSRIANTHYDPAYAGVDWEGVRLELRPRAAAARTLGELRGVIVEMLDRLGESHYGLIPHEVADALGADGSRGGAVSGDAGMAIRLVDGEMLVSAVGAEGAGAAAGIRTGWTVVAVNGGPLAPRVAAVAALPDAEQRRARTRLLYEVNGQLRGDVGDTLRLHLRAADGREVERPVVLRAAPGEVIRFGNLPPMLALLQHQALPAGRSCVGMIRLNVWMVPLSAAFDRAVDELRHCRGMVIDLRGNPGGVAGMVMGTAGHFLGDTVSLGFMRQRGSELRFKANPRRVRPDGTSVQPFAGPVAVLIDEMSASTSEFFAAALQAIGRARVFGTVSAGQALPAAMLRLPTRDVLMHVVADFTGPGGVRIEGRGVVPDDIIASSKQDLLHGRDTPLDAAVHWINAVPATTGATR
jgi:carboxyl-terminal processing protease